MSLEERISCMRNRRVFSFENDCGAVAGNGIRDDIGDFDMLIRPNSFPLRSQASRAIFKLISFYVIGQTANERASNIPAVDLSGFYIQVNGLGFEGAFQTNAKSCGSSTGAGVFFPIFNKDGGTDNGNSDVLQRISGGECNMPEILCSNPIGTTINIKAYNMDADVPTPITHNDNLSSIITFSIELIPDI